jgi:site-specific recombinase
MSENSNEFKSVSLFNKIRQLFSNPVDTLVLNDLLCQETVDDPLCDKMHWFEMILQWLFQDQSHVDTRFRFFFKVLEQNPEWKTNFKTTFSQLLIECRFIGFFTDVGYAVEHGLWGDIAQRITQKIVPIRARTDFQNMFLEVFEDSDDLIPLRNLSDENLLLIANLIQSAEAQAGWKEVTRQAREALLFLSTHVAHYGISSEIMGRLALRDEVSKSSFYKLADSFRQLDLDQARENVEGCERDLEQVYASMENSGVSVDVVNRLETVSALLFRMRTLLDLTVPSSDVDRLRQLRDFLVRVIEAGNRGRTVIGYVKRHFYLLSRKIVERNGHSGEHYIARAPGELATLFKSSFGGGLIVVIMTIFKISFLHLDPAPFFRASGIWIIYAVGFLAMQFTHCTLATKIPSFTASRLAGLLKTGGKRNLPELREEIKLTFLSQSIALLGNMVGVIPFAFLLSAYFVMDEAYARHVLSGLNPIFSFAILLGALTGVQLWLSSVAGGWFENWIVFHRIPDTIENHFRLRKILGDQSAKKLAAWLLENASGIATNVTLGFLFGFIPLFAGLFGLDGNGHHVTISSASATFAVGSLKLNLSTSEWIYTGAGLLVVAAMNFGVSFCLALFIAANSQRIKFRRVLYYMTASVKSEMPTKK